MDRLDDLQRYVLRYLDGQPNPVRPVAILESIDEGWKLLFPVMDALREFEKLCMVDVAVDRDETTPAGRSVFLYAINERGRRKLKSLPPPSAFSRLRGIVGMGIRPASKPAPPTASPPASEAERAGQFDLVDHVDLDFPSLDDPDMGMDLETVALSLDWEMDGERLKAGDLTGLFDALREPVEEVVARPEVASLANDAGVTPVALVLGALAKAASRRREDAAPVAVALLAGVPDAAVARTLEWMGLEPAFKSPGGPPCPRSRSPSP